MLNFGSGRDLRVVGLNPALGSELRMESAGDSLSLRLRPSPARTLARTRGARSLAHTLSLSL